MGAILRDLIPHMAAMLFGGLASSFGLAWLAMKPRSQSLLSRVKGEVLLFKGNLERHEGTSSWPRYGASYRSTDSLESREKARRASGGPGCDQPGSRTSPSRMVTAVPARREPCRCRPLGLTPHERRSRTAHPMALLGHEAGRVQESPAPQVRRQAACCRSGEGILERVRRDAEVPSRRVALFGEAAEAEEMWAEEVASTAELSVGGDIEGGATKRVVSGERDYQLRCARAHRLA